MAKYINTETGEYPISEAQIRLMYPDTSFPAIFVPPEHFKVVFPAPVPPHDPLTEGVQEVAPVLTSKGHYEQRYQIIHF